VAAEIACEVRRVAKAFGGHQVGTVGRLEVSPGLVNVVSNRVVMTVDLRNTDEARLQEAEQLVFGFAERSAAAEGVGLARRPLARFAPVAFEPKLVARVEALAKELGHKVRRLPSGAGHDAQILAGVCPACMIFVPSVKGISHNVAEYTAPADLAAGAEVLLRLLQELAA
jgi:N-carbamoyl-L-amino-acid hydrolase